MVCPYCDGETEVVNSRVQKRNNQIWRRRRCQKCQTVFTTHESVYLPQLFVVAKGETRKVFEPVTLSNELVDALRHSHNKYEAASELSAQIIRNLIKNASNGLILAQNISLETARVLKNFDKQAYLRFVAEHPSLHNQITSDGRRAVRS